MEMLRLISRRLDVQTISIIYRHKLIFAIVWLVSALLLSINIYYSALRYLEHDVQQIKSVSQMDALPMPVITLGLKTTRNSTIDASKFTIPFISSINISSAKSEIPAWAWRIDQDDNFRNIVVNQVNYRALKTLNLTLDNIRSLWPLKSSSSVLSDFNGISITITLNADDFIEWPDTNGNHDAIELVISNFETDYYGYSAVGMSVYNLLPCEQIRLNLELEHYTRLHRSSAPCRDDYPDFIKRLIREPIAVKLLNNPIFSPHLPYNQQTCQDICSTQYLLKKCSCYMEAYIWRYAGMPKEFPLCETIRENCTMDIPNEVISDCDCYPVCSSYHFHVHSKEKFRFDYGKLDIKLP